MKSTVFDILIIIIWTVTSCQSNKNKIMTHYQRHPQHFDEFVDAAYQDQNLLNHKNRLVSYDKLNDQTKKRFKS